jgi:hypothetical protein
LGNPGQVIKKVSDEMIDWKTKGTALYQALPEDLYDSLKECEPLTEMPADRPKQDSLYETWNNIKKG